MRHLIILIAHLVTTVLKLVRLRTSSVAFCLSLTVHADGWWWSILADIHWSHERQLMERRLISMRIGGLTNLLGNGRHGSVHAQNHRFWNSTGHR